MSATGARLEIEVKHYGPGSAEDYDHSTLLTVTRKYAADGEAMVRRVVFENDDEIRSLIQTLQRAINACES